MGSTDIPLTWPTKQTQKDSTVICGLLDNIPLLSSTASSKFAPQDNVLLLFDFQDCDNLITTLNAVVCL